jgi:hypothetical protein
MTSLCLLKKLKVFQRGDMKSLMGIVRPYHFFAFMTEWSDPYDKDTTRTCLVPPDYQRDWIGDLQLPLYVYTSIQINSFSDKLIELLKELSV